MSALFDPRRKRALRRSVRSVIAGNPGLRAQAKQLKRARRRQWLNRQTGNGSFGYLMWVFMFAVFAGWLGFHSAEGGPGIALYALMLTATAFARAAVIQGMLGTLVPSQRTLACVQLGIDDLTAFRFLVARYPLWGCLVAGDSLIYGLSAVVACARASGTWTTAAWLAVPLWALAQAVLAQACGIWLVRWRPRLPFILIAAPIGITVIGAAWGHADIPAGVLAWTPAGLLQVALFTILAGSAGLIPWLVLVGIGGIASVALVSGERRLRDRFHQQFTLPDGLLATGKKDVARAAPAATAESPVASPTAAAGLAATAAAPPAAVEAASRPAVDGPAGPAPGGPAASSSDPAPDPAPVAAHPDAIRAVERAQEGLARRQGLAAAAATAATAIARARADFGASLGNLGRISGLIRACLSPRLYAVAAVLRPQRVMPGPKSMTILVAMVLVQHWCHLWWPIAIFPIAVFFVRAINSWQALLAPGLAAVSSRDPAQVQALLQNQGSGGVPVIALLPVGIGEVVRTVLICDFLRTLIVAPLIVAVAAVACARGPLPDAFSLDIALKGMAVFLVVRPVLLMIQMGGLNNESFGCDWRTLRTIMIWVVAVPGLLALLAGLFMIPGPLSWACVPGVGVIGGLMLLRQCRAWNRRAFDLVVLKLR